MRPRRDRRIAERVSDWFLCNAREFPWRPAKLAAPRDPYRVLVSEIMLQQTQAARVVERFETFVERFPTVRALADADEQDVLALWSGLGYYSRARNLHAAAREIVDRLDGKVPGAAEALRRLPGIGRYTAGAVASLAFGESVPAVDANVARVLLRIDGREASPSDPGEMARLGARAQALVVAATPEPGPGVVNESLIELGAVLCTPRAPRCDACPLRRACVARREGLVARIPVPKRAAVRKRLHCATVVVTDEAGRVLLERRPSSGLWAGLWQSPTLERLDRPPTRDEIRAHADVRSAEPAGTLTHATTHRDVRFEVLRACAAGGWENGRRWVARDRLGEVGLSSPQRRIIDLALGDAGGLFGAVAAEGA